MRCPILLRIAALGLLLFGLSLTGRSAVQAQVPSNVFRRVLMIKAGKSIGTGFTIDVDGRQYLITAKHLVAKLKSEDSIAIWKNDDWSAVKVKVLLCKDPIDIAVLVPPSQLTVSFELEPTIVGLRFAQDVYFCGFPYGYFFTSGQTINGFYPVPFLKKALISAQSRVEDGVAQLFLDGHNNPGFSGGPIVYRDLDRNDFAFKVAGVVSGYQPELTPVMKAVPVKPNEDLSGVEQWRIRIEDGKKIRYEDTQKMVATNTGIVTGYAIDFAVDLIKRNPIGPRVVD